MRWLIVLLTLTACSSTPRTDEPITPAANVTATNPKSLPAPSPDYVVFITSVTGGTEADRLRLWQIARNTERVVNSVEFRFRLLNNEYAGKPGFFDKNNPTPTSVLQRIRNGDEFSGKKDYVWQYDLHIVRLAEGVYGATTRPYLPIKFNELYLRNRKDSGLAGTYCHEKAHQLGYSHSRERTPQRQYSVPYVLGTICAETYVKLFGGGK